jgi:hypothetical protein
MLQAVLQQAAVTAATQQRTGLMGWQRRLSTLLSCSLRRPRHRLLLLPGRTAPQPTAGRWRR